MEVFKLHECWHMTLTSMALMATLLEQGSLLLVFSSSVPESVVLEDVKLNYSDARVTVRRAVLN